MRTRYLFTVAAAVVIAVGSAWWLMRPAAPPVDAPMPAAADAPALRAAPQPAPATSIPNGDAERDRVLEAYYEPLRFRDEITAFIDGVDERETAENVAQLDALSRRIRDYQQAGYLALPQARYLEGALISAVYRNDDAARRLALEDLRADYAERAEAPSTAHLDARFEAYKAREAEIVRDVLGNEPPAGMTRDAWLRQRLDALREEIYAER